MTGRVGAVGIAAGAGAGDVAEARHRKLTDAAQQFEGMLLEEMLKPMKQSGPGEDDGQSVDDNKEGGGFSDTLNSFGVEAMAAAIARQGGMGIAKLVIAQVERASGQRGHG